MRARHSVARVLISAGGRIEWTLGNLSLFMPWRTDAVASSRQAARKGARTDKAKKPRRGAVQASWYVVKKGQGESASCDGDDFFFRFASEK